MAKANRWRPGCLHSCDAGDPGGKPEIGRYLNLYQEFEKYVLDTEAHMLMTPWYYRIIPYRSYVKGWKISPSHYLNQDLATVWLDK
jgi:peptide/nickel transport system substrate-binding protein